MRTHLKPILVVERKGAFKEGKGKIVGKLQPKQEAQLRLSEAVPEQLQFGQEGE